MINIDLLESISYETRNLGVAAFAPTSDFLENPDSASFELSIQEKLREFGNIFIQARIPKESMKTATILQDLGFYFVETTLVPQTRFSRNLFLKRFIEEPRFFVPSRYTLNQVEVRVVEKQNPNMKQIIEEISKNSFIDDRFHVDPNCPYEIANQRFVNWVRDLYSDREVVFYTLSHKINPIGFMARKGFKLILAGFSKRYRNSGLGDFLWLSVMQDMLNQGLGKASTLISSNNTPVLNLYARLGFQFKHPEATFHYWSK